MMSLLLLFVLWNAQPVEGFFTFGYIQGSSVDTVLGIQTFLLTISILQAMEFGLGFLDFLLKDKEIYMNMLKRIYGELTIMGIISFGIVMITAGNSYLSENTLLWITGIDNAHYLLFFTVLFFVAHAFCLMYVSSRSASDYLRMERISKQKLANEIEELTPWQRFFSFRVRYMDLSFSSARRTCEYKILERLFKDTYWLPDNFDFASYVTRAFEHHALYTMEIGFFNWMVLILLVVLNFIRNRFDLGFNCDPDDASYALEFIKRVNRQDGETNSDTESRRRLGGGDLGAVHNRPSCTRFQLYLMVICCVLLTIYTMCVLVLARYYELRLLSRAGVCDGQDNLQFLQVLVDDEKQQEEKEMIRKKTGVSRQDVDIAAAAGRTTIVEFKNSIETVFNDMEANDEHDTTHAIYIFILEKCDQVYSFFEHNVYAATTAFFNRLLRIDAAAVAAAAVKVANSGSVGSSTNSGPTSKEKLDQIFKDLQSDGQKAQEKAKSEELKSKKQVATLLTTQLKGLRSESIEAAASAKQQQQGATSDAPSSPNADKDRIEGEREKEEEEDDEAPYHLSALERFLYKKLVDSRKKARAGRKRISPSPGAPASAGASESSVDSSPSSKESASVKARKEDEDKHKIHVSLSEDFNDMFLLGRPELFYNANDVAIMFCCFYLAIWATNFITLASKYPHSSIAWQAILAFPMVLAIQMLVTINKTVSIIKAVCTLDLKLALAVCEEQIDSDETVEELRRHALQKMRDIFSDINTLDEKLEAVDVLFDSIDIDGGGTLDHMDFRSLLRSLSLKYSDSRFRRLFRCVDRDGGGSLDKSEFFALLFPDDEYTTERSDSADERERRMQGRLDKMAAERRSNKAASHGGALGMLQAVKNRAHEHVVSHAHNIGQQFGKHARQDSKNAITASNGGDDSSSDGENEDGTRKAKKVHFYL